MLWQQRFEARCSFDHLVGACEERGWDGKRQGGSNARVDDELKCRRLLDRKVSGLGSLQDSIHVGGCTLEKQRDIGTVCDQAATFGVLAERIYGRDPAESHEFHDLRTFAKQQGV